MVKGHKLAKKGGVKRKVGYYMKPQIKTLTFFLLFILLASSKSFGQVATTAVPFLLISPSPESNGMAGISSSIMTDDPIAMVTNPAQLGFQSLDRLASYSTYAKKTQWLPKFKLPDLTYDVSAGLLGINSDQFISLPFKLSLGVGYSRVFLNLGDITQTNSRGQPIGTFHSYEKSDAITTAVGFEYLVKFGFGFNFKKILSKLSPSGTGQEQTEVKLSAYDVGILLNVPVFSVISHISTKKDFEIYPGTSSTLDFTLEYSKSNISDEVVYEGFGVFLPLPRYATVGLAVELSIVFKTEPIGWKLVSLAFARQTEDILIKRFSDGSFAYQNGVGDIQMFDGIVLGKRNSSTELRTGWRLSLYEMFTLRIGWYDGTGNLNYRTLGVGFQLSGIWKLLKSSDSELTKNAIGEFLSNYIDFSFNFSLYDKDESPIDDTTFFGIVLILR